jgi:molecular chaperone GrpE (heat shock protein)
MNESDPTRFPTAELIDRMEQVLQELRRQGRAAVAAQAAAESCLAEIQRLAEAGPPAAASRASEGDWLLSLLPAFDALDASVAQASALQQELGRARWLTALPPVRHLVGDVLAFLRGVGMVRAQFDRGLEQAGIRVDRQTGVAVDPSRHRVLEVRPVPRGGRRGQVLRVLRAGYRSASRCLREAEVQASEDAR